MAIFRRNENITEGEQTKANLASLAGGVAGLGAGTLATIPIDSHYQNEILYKARLLEIEKAEARQNWKTLLQLARGRITLDDLPTNEREFYAEQLVKQDKVLRHLVKDPIAAKKSLDELAPKVRVLHPTTTTSVPNTPIFKGKVHAPISKVLPVALGSLGLAGAGYGAEKYFENRQNEDE